MTDTPTLRVPLLPTARTPLVIRPSALTAAFDPAQPRVESGPTGGQWTSDGDSGGDAPVDQATKDAYSALLGMTPAQRAAFLAKMPPDQLKKLGAFAATGKATKGDIAQIKNAVGDTMKARGLDPASVGLKEKPGKKGKAAGKKGGSGKPGGGSKSGGSGKKSGGGGGKSSSGGGSKSSGSKKSSSSGGKSSSGKKTTAEKKPAKEQPPPPAPPALVRLGPPGSPPPRGGVPTPQPATRKPVRASGAPLVALPTRPPRITLSSSSQGGTP